MKKICMHILHEFQNTENVFFTLLSILLSLTINPLKKTMHVRSHGSDRFSVDTSTLTLVNMRTKFFYFPYFS